MRRKKRSAEQKDRRISPQMIREAVTFLLIGAFSMMAAVLLVIALGKRMEMAGDSMSPTIENGDHVLINRLVYQMSTPKRDDIIVFYGSGNRMRTYIKRVVAVSGDTVRIADGILYVNGEPEENTSFDRMEDAGIASREITLGSGEYFVLGDNRNASEDSRSANIGVVHRDTITGKVWYTY